jgi:hypothetical protein
MALEGNLTAFGLSEILQLIAVQQKTGMLTVTNGDDSTVMFFRGGEIISTRDRRRKSRDSFKEYISRYGVLERDEMIRISQISAQSKLDFVDILTSEGFLDPQELAKHWRKQVQETMHDVLTWEEGTYKFVSGQELVDGIRSPESFNVEGMLMESMRRIDEFPHMLEMLPSEKLLFRRSDSASNAEEMTENESTILSMLDSAATLRDLIARGKMPVFEVYESLKNLREKELIHVEEPEPEGDERTRETARVRTQHRAIKNVLPLLVAFSLFAGAMYLGFRDSVDLLSPQVLAKTRPLSGQQIERSRMEHQLRWLIEAYRVDHGYYPPNLGELEDEGLASEAFLERARSLAFRYRLTASRTGYTLL